MSAWDDYYPKFECCVFENIISKADANSFVDETCTLRINITLVGQDRCHLKYLDVSDPYLLVAFGSSGAVLVAAKYLVL